MKVSLATLLTIVFLAMIGCSSSNNAVTTLEPSASSIFLKGEEAVKKGDYRKAAKYYQEASKQNYYKATTNLATLYLHGKGVPKNYNKAISLYKKVINIAPDPIANYNLARVYFLQKKYQKAISNYQISRRMGEPSASNMLGYMYNFGLGVRKNNAIARDYYIEAATKENVDAINNLGFLEAKERNFRQARQWFNKAAALGNEVAIKNLSILEAEGH